MSDIVIQTQKLTRYFGDVTAADSVDLQIRKGEIYGFLGLNGAGKTTTIRMLLGMIRPSSGNAFLFEEEIKPGRTDLWNRVGHLVEIPYSYPELTVRENLELFRRLRLLKPREAINDVIDQLRLGRFMNIKAKDLSLGNMQRLGLAKALIHKPPLLILDEPANGLDPAGIVQIRELLTDLAFNHGVTIFISSHILGEISRLATRIGIIHDGKIIRESDTHQLKSKREIVLKLNTQDNEKASELLFDKGYTSIQLRNGALELHDEMALLHPENISRLLIEQGFELTRICREEEDLEDYFFRIIQNYHKEL
jgi:ABC-2 type transport system ATP-binding protein